jgi:hypothetical protein
LKAVEDARAAAELKASDDARVAAELKAVEDARVAAELKAVEDARVAAELKAVEDARVAAELKAVEDARVAAELKAVEDAKKKQLELYEHKIANMNKVVECISKINDTQKNSMFKLQSNNVKLTDLITSYPQSTITDEDLPNLYNEKYNIFTNIMREIQSQKKYYNSKMSSCFNDSIFNLEFKFAIIPLSYEDIKRILNNKYDSKPIKNKIWILGVNIIVLNTTELLVEGIRDLLIRANTDAEGGLISILAQLIQYAKNQNMIQLNNKSGAGYTIKLTAKPEYDLFNITQNIQEIFNKIKDISSKKGGRTKKKGGNQKKSNSKTRKRQKSKKNRKKRNRNKSQKNN